MVDRLRGRTPFGLVALLVSALAPAPARGDNLADEAELQFELGAERYKAGDFRAALEHFLASNRLVSNSNVVFDIARAYEQLGQHADAYRYYNQALEDEKDPATRKRLEDAVRRMEPLIAVLRVESEPPGATIYIQRRDLGARGNAPVSLGVGPGSYRVIADFPGYESSETNTTVTAGTRTSVTVHLKQIVAGLRVEGQPAGAVVRVDDDRGPVSCNVPCTIDLPPGRHMLFGSAPGYQNGVTIANVTPGVLSSARLDLAPLTGSLLVGSQVPEALVTVDGVPRGFTPSALLLPLGPHSVTVTHSGFRALEQRVDVTADGQAKVEADLTPVEEVTAASRATEAVEDAPSSVSIITAAELRAMGYPTIAEAIRGVRGVFLGNDTSYESVGFRGFSPLGSYGNTVLVLVDGHSTNDDYVGSAYVSFDARADIDDIERIEVVRGPGSVLYGTGAFFGVINLVTRDRNAPTHGEVAVSTSSNSVGHARATGQLRLSPDAGAWVSVAGAHGSGQTFFFPEFASDPATGGFARGVDGFDTGTVNGRVWYKALSLQWLLTSRKKQLPAGEYSAVFADPRMHFADTRGFVEATFEPTISKRVQVLSRAYADMYDFDDLIPYTPENGGMETEAFRGRWVGLEERLVYSPVQQARFTAGGEGQLHLLAHQTGLNQGVGTYLDRDDPFSVAAGYLLADLTPTESIKASGGARLDYYTSFGTSLNPRGSIIVRPYRAGNLKLVVGRAFRAPSVYEHYYAGTTQIPSTGLKPEQVLSGELEFTHRFSPTFSATLSTYTNYVTDLIVLGGDGTESSPNVYTNLSNPVETRGAEIEVRREWSGGWMLGATYAFQHSRFLENGGASPLRDVPNSPEHLGSIKAAAPIIGSFLSAMTRLSFQGPSFDRNYHPSDAPQGSTEPFALWDVVLSGESPRYGVRYALGLYNAMDYRYRLPVSEEFTPTAIQQPGRTVMLSTQLTF